MSRDLNSLWAVDFSGLSVVGVKCRFGDFRPLRGQLFGLSVATLKSEVTVVYFPNDSMCRHSSKIRCTVVNIVANTAIIIIINTKVRIFKARFRAQNICFFRFFGPVGTSLSRSNGIYDF